MSRIRRGWQLTGKSWRVPRSHPARLRFPIYGALVALVPLLSRPPPPEALELDRLQPEAGHRGMDREHRPRNRAVPTLTAHMLR